MDTVTYTDVGVRQVKRTDHLLNWKLIILVVVLLTSYIDSSDQSEIVTCCRGGNASITWDYELPPFFVIEWYVNDTQIAEKSKPSFSQDVLHINGDYTRRFRLHNNTGVGFTITNVTEADERYYKCLVTLRKHGTVNTLKKELQVVVCNTSDTSMRITNPGERTTTPNPTECANTLAIVSAILCGIIALLVLGGICWRCKRSVLIWCNNPQEDEESTQMNSPPTQKDTVI